MSITLVKNQWQLAISQRIILFSPKPMGSIKKYNVVKNILECTLNTSGIHAEKDNSVPFASESKQKHAKSG